MSVRSEPLGGDSHENRVSCLRATTRPGWDDYFIEIAQAVAQRADCQVRRHGVVIVRDRRVVSTGYNGSPPGGPSCLAGECPRALKPREERPRTDYSDCVALHAEQNAIAHAGRDTIGATLYLNVRPPCDMCLKLIRAAGIVRVVWPGGEIDETK